MDRTQHPSVLIDKRFQAITLNALRPSSLRKTLVLYQASESSSVSLFLPLKLLRLYWDKLA